jgi:hypothetical protein
VDILYLTIKIFFYYKLYILSAAIDEQFVFHDDTNILVEFIYVSWTVDARVCVIDCMIVEFTAIFSIIGDLVEFINVSWTLDARVGVDK